MSGASGRADDEGRLSAGAAVPDESLGHQRGPHPGRVHRREPALGGERVHGRAGRPGARSAGQHRSQVGVAALGLRSYDNSD